MVLASGEVVGAEQGLVWTGTVNPDGTLSDATPATLMYWDSAEQRLVQAEVDSSVIDEVNNFINDGANRQISIKKNDRQEASLFYHYTATDLEGNQYQREIERWTWNTAENRWMQIFDIEAPTRMEEITNSIRTQDGLREQDLRDWWGQLLAQENFRFTSSSVSLGEPTELGGMIEGGKGIAVANYGEEFGYPRHIVAMVFGAGTEIDYVWFQISHADTTPIVIKSINRSKGEKGISDVKVFIPYYPGVFLDWSNDPNVKVAAGFDWILLRRLYSAFYGYGTNPESIDELAPDVQELLLELQTRISEGEPGSRNVRSDSKQ